MKTWPSAIIETGLVLCAMACGSADDGMSNENDRFVCAASNGGLNLCANHYGNPNDQQLAQLNSQTSCRLEPCSETRPEVCGEIQGMQGCRPVRPLGRCEVRGGTIVGAEQIPVTRVEHVVYDATALRGVVIVYSKEESVQSCDDMGGEWHDQYTSP